MPSPKLEILAYESTPLGVLCLRRRELASRPGTVVTEVTLDHEFLMSSYHTASERALASHALERHAGRELQVMVGGLGLGYTAAAVLDSPRVGHVEVVELLPQVADWMARELVPLAPRLNADPRFSVRSGDVYRLLGAAPERRWDMILIDVDHSPEEHLAAANETFYTAAGLAAAREHLAPGGVLGIWSYAEHSPLSRALGEVFGTVAVEPVCFHNDLIGEDQSDWLFFARD